MTVTDVQFRQATFIETSIANVMRVLVEALVIVAIVLFVFLLNWQTTLISLVAIPLSVLATVLVFQMMGLGINTMTLGGLAIAIGALVDDAVVDVENIYRRLGQWRASGGRDRRSVSEVVADASIEVRSGILYATAIIVLVFLPLFALSGIEGRLFTPLGIAFIVSILASLAVAMTVTPVLSVLAAAADGASGGAGFAIVAGPEAVAGARAGVVLCASARGVRAAGVGGAGCAGERDCCCRARFCRASTRGRCSSA